MRRHASLFALVLAAVAIACGGSAPSSEAPVDPTKEVSPANTNAGGPASADPMQACKDIDASLGSARKIEVGLENFTSEGGFGEAWVDANNKVLKLKGGLAAESSNREVEFHYAAGVPVCVMIQYNRYNKPIFEEGGGEVEQVDKYMRVYKGDELVFSRHNDKSVNVADDSDHKTEREDAVEMGKHAEAVARGDVDM